MDIPFAACLWPARGRDLIVLCVHRDTNRRAAPEKTRARLRWKNAVNIG